MSDIQPVHRRTVARHAVALECECLRESGLPPITQLLLDLSPEGAFIKTDECDVELGEELRLTFPVSDGDERMDVRAKVVRYGRESFHGDPVWGLGVHFVGLEGADHDRLARSLEGLPPPVPTAARSMDYASFVQSVDDGA